MPKKSWRECTDPYEIMEMIKGTKSVDKFQVLEYFGRYQRNLKMLEKLLESGYYTPEEIVKKRSSTYADWTYAPTRKMLLDFANLTWQKLDDVQKIMSVNVGLVRSKYELFLIKLKYFKQHNSEIYEQLLKTSEGQSYLRDLFHELAFKPEKNKKQLFNILIKYPKLYDGFRLMEFRDMFTEAEFSQIQEVQKDWRRFPNAELIMNEATQENKWEIFEYFANHDETIFKSIIDGYTTKFEQTDEIVYSRSEILERYGNVDLDTLPKCLKNYILSLKQSVIRNEELKLQRKEERAKAKKERLLSWVDENGLPISLFTIGSIILETREDYFKVLKKYLAERKSIKSFCEKYKISDEKGFKKMLEKFAEEDESLSQQINEVMESQQRMFLDTVKEVLIGVCEEGKPLSIALGFSRRITLEYLQNFAKKYYSEKHYCEIFTEKVIEYYYDRLNSYTNSKDPENISKMLTMDEIRFIVGEEEYSEIIHGKTCDIDKLFYKRVAFLNNTNQKLIQEKVTGGKPDKIIKALAKYNVKFKKQKYLQGEIFIMLESGKQVEVTSEMVEMALQFAYSKKLHASITVMGYIINAVANGKIKNEQETKQTRAEMEKQASSLIETITDIDEYFAVIDSLNS